MKILIIGGTGTIGKAVEAELKKRHEVVVASYQKGDVCVDITSPESIKAMYKQIGQVDAIIATTGKVHFADLSEMDADKYQIGLNNKLMGQINLVLIGQDYLNDGGSFTLTSGILNVQPIAQGSSAAMVNGAIDAFTKAAAIELPRGLRINTVSPTVIEEAMPVYEPFFRGFEPVSAHRAALAYVRSVEGLWNGEIIRVGY